MPADQTIMQDEATADGTYRIDPAKLWAEAIRLAEGSADWIIEDDYRISAEHDTDPWAVSRTPDAAALRCPGADLVPGTDGIAVSRPPIQDRVHGSAALRARRSSARCHGR